MPEVPMIDVLQRLRDIGFGGNDRDAANFLHFIGLQDTMRLKDFQRYLMNNARSSAQELSGLPDQEAATIDVPDWQEFIIAAALLGDALPKAPNRLKRVFRLRHNVDIAGIVKDVAERSKQWYETE